MANNATLSPDPADGRLFPPVVTVRPATSLGFDGPARPPVPKQRVLP